MPYTINKTNGLKITVVQDGTINTNSLDITLVGKNYTGYGEAFNENFVKLLENFANATQPKKPLSGQLWYDTTNKKITVYNGTVFKPLAVINNGTKPSQSVSNLGDLWWDPTAQKLYAYNGSSYVLVGPIISRSGNTGSLASTVANDDSKQDTVVIKETVDGNIAFISSAFLPFNVSPDDSVYSNPDVRLQIIRPGINLPGASSDTGISVTNVAQSSGYMLWGTAATAIRLVRSNLVSYSADDFLLRAELSSLTGQVNVETNDGILIGSPSALKIHITPTRVGNISLFNGDSSGGVIKINVNSTASGVSTLTNVVSFDGSGGTLKVLPNPSTSVSIGSVSSPFNQIYASSINGSLIYDNSSRVITSVTANAGADISITNATTSGPSASFRINNTSTLQTVTGRGATTNNILHLTNTTNATSPTNSGALQIAGGASIAQDLYVGGKIVADQLTIQLTTVTTTNVVTDDIISTYNITNATTSTRSGALQVDGGQSIAKDLWVGGRAYVAGSPILTVASLSGAGVSEITAGTGVSVSSPTGAVTISIGQSVATSATPTFSGITATNITATNISSGAQGTAGTITGQWTLVGSSTLQATYADIAERYHADQEYHTGTVLVIGGQKEVTTTDRHGDPAVAGIVSANPAFILNSQAGTNATHPYVALKGRVPCWVVGPVTKGDLLVTSNRSGFAARATGLEDPNAVLAIALENLLTPEGLIEVMVK